VGTRSPLTRWCGGVERAGARIAQSIRIRSEFLTVASRCARLFGRAEQQSVMLTTLLVIIACIAAGTIVNHFHPEYRKW
jgi:hypothetical protein